MQIAAAGTRSANTFDEASGLAVAARASGIGAHRCRVSLVRAAKLPNWLQNQAGQESL
jgi:hypothetical protein